METNSTEMEWQEKECLNGQVFIKCPVDWTQLSEEAAATKFPWTPKPQEIYADLEGGKILTLNLLDKILPEEQVYSAIREVQRMVGHLYPENIRESAREAGTGRGKAGWFSFTTDGMKKSVVHYMFVMPADKKMLFGGYHFPADEMGENRCVFLEMLKSIRIECRR